MHKLKEKYLMKWRDGKSKFWVAALITIAIAFSLVMGSCLLSPPIAHWLSGQGWIDCGIQQGSYTIFLLYIPTVHQFLTQILKILNNNFSRVSHIHKNPKTFKTLIIPSDVFIQVEYAVPNSSRVSPGIHSSSSILLPEITKSKKKKFVLAHRHHK